MVQSSSISITPAQHADNHRTGGSDPLTGVVGIDAMQPAAHKTTHEPGGADQLSLAGDEYTMTGDTLFANDSEKGNTTDSYVMVKRITLGSDIPDEIRIHMELKSLGGNTCYGRIYRNGVAVGTERSTANSVYQLYDQDISGWSPGDTLEVWSYCINAAGSTATIRNLRILGTVKSLYVVPVANDP